MCVKALFLGIHLSIKGPHSTLPPENEMGECPALHIATTILLRACMMESPYLMPHIHPTIHPSLHPCIPQALSETPSRRSTPCPGHA